MEGSGTVWIDADSARSGVSHGVHDLKAGTLAAYPTGKEHDADAETDAVDTDAAARAALPGRATITPKTADGRVRFDGEFRALYKSAS